ncbi:MAG: hypothetical protein R3F17_00025 [Planctomycetota bacterium]
MDQTNTHYTVLTGDWTILDRDDTYMVTQDSADNANLSLFTWAGGQWNQATGADFKQLAGAFPGADLDRRLAAAYPRKFQFVPVPSDW